MSDRHFGIIAVLTQACRVVASSSMDGTAELELQVQEAIDRVDELIEALTLAVNDPGDDAYWIAKARTVLARITYISGDL